MDGTESLEDQEGRGRQSSDINDSLSDLVSSYPFLSSREMAETLHTSHNTVLSYLRDLGKTLKYGRWLPHKLSESNKLPRFTVASSLLSLNQIGHFLKRIVTSYEKWIQYDNSVSKRQWLDKDKIPRAIFKPENFGKNQMLCIWWDYQGVIHFEILKFKETVNSELHYAQLEMFKNC